MIIVEDNKNWLFVFKNNAWRGFLCPCVQQEYCSWLFFFFPVPVCAITASVVPGGTFVSMNRFNTLCG
jgi:hypothetical protein